MAAMAESPRQNVKGRRSAPFASAAIARCVAESGQNWPRVNHDRDDGAGRQNEGDGRKSNELVHNRLLLKLKL
jgi:hypothetical protein